MATKANPASGGAQHLIDVHHHIIPPFYLAENRDRIAGSRGGQITPAWLEWTPEKALIAMDQQHVATAVLSLSSPGVWFGDVQTARTTARRSNEYAAELASKHPGRFGLFAALPLPDAEGSLREIEHAFNVLKADGIGLLTSYADKWLGDPAYRPVFEELNRRKAVIFVHPTTPTCCQTLMPGVATVVAEVPHDTTRTIISLLYSGMLAQFKDIRFIFSHAGGTLPVIAGRIIDYAPKDLAQKAPNGVEYELKRFYYDLAISGNRPAFAALKQLVPMSQILFGSDHPYRPLVESSQGMMNFGLSAADLRAIGWDNALALLPTLKARI
ncbi:MAG: amidohydrolase [Betaproteobacteria bacterium]|nr:amidohydrolase [Betaproteobacteria bacterium]